MFASLVKKCAVLGLIAPSLLLGVVQGRVRCYSIFDCEKKVRAGSECVNGFCSNPYHSGGCLMSRLEDHHKLRTCNSDDPPSAKEEGHCLPSALGYTEVRISSQNWESAFFSAWVLQILLSELMDVPATIETGDAESNVDFYNIDTSFDYGKSNVWDSLKVAKQVEDCRKVKGGVNYTACSHVYPEVWANHEATLLKLRDEQIVETPGGLGALGQQMWFTRRKTGEMDPTLLNYLGIRGEKNRKKLADTFKRPTTWGDYCEHISDNNCTEPDMYALRAPLPGEEGRYHLDDGFNGYFWYTEKNNCTSNPTCTGHIVDYPCGWSSYVSQQTYHLGIALESNGNQPGSNGYAYGEMVQIWTAANALDENVILQWWTPESLYQEFLGTDSEFQIITLPPPTQECVENRVPSEERCSDDPLLRVGNPKGACAEAPHALFKVISTALFELSNDPDVPTALHSPAYEAVKNFRISDLQYGSIFDLWFEKNLDKWGLDPRDAVCEWFVENIDTLKSYVPRTHPRVMEDNNDVYKQPVFYVGVALAVVALVSCSVSSILVYYHRQKHSFRYTQIEFLYMLLIGLSLVSAGSLMTAMTPTDQICVAIGWFVNYGYTLELVPLIVKVAAINRLMVAQARMQRVELKKSSLFGAVLFVCTLVGITLIVWTVTDPPRKQDEIELTNDTTQNGETVIERTFYCSSDQDVWNYLGVSWQLILLLSASVLAFQTRKMREDLNDSKVLAMMIYSHFVFVVLRAITYLLDGSLSQYDLAAARSIIYSGDVLATLLIYFLPKFLESPEQTFKHTPGHQEQPVPLSVHKWRSRQPSSTVAPSRTRGGAPSSTPASDHSSQDVDFGNSLSLRQSSVDYHLKAEWEDSEDEVLEAVSEEETSEVDDMEDEGTN